MKKIKGIGMKVIVSELTEQDMARIKAINIEKAKAYFGMFPMSNTIYLSMKTGLPTKFIKDNWDEITK